MFQVKIIDFVYLILMIEEVNEERLIDQSVKHR